MNLDINLREHLTAKKKILRNEEIKDVSIYIIEEN